MVARTSSGTGIVVSLVVFVLCTVFLLVLTIVFYSGQTKAAQAEAAANTALGKYVTREQRNREQIKAIEASVNPARGESVVRYLQTQNQDLMGYVYGDPHASLRTLQSEFIRYGVPEDGTESVNSVLREMSRDLRSKQTDLDSLTAKVSDRGDEISELYARIEQMSEAHRDELDAMRGQIDTYSKAVEEYRGDVQEVKNEYYGAIDRLKQQYEGDIASLENEKDALHQERAVLKQRVDELQAILSENRLRRQNPAMLVDGTIIDTTGSNDQVFIDRGKKHHIVLGMTFEVYDNEAALQQVDRLTGQLPRGKASIQVIKVAQTTSTCKITRSVPGRPVVREDVIANAIYDPNYVFKFLVHGKFDVDDDGRPSEAEAEYLRSLIIDWGGAVVTGEQLPGDLDFLVLGIEPPLPLPLPANATQFQIDDWVRKRRAHEKYQELFRQAREAQIPVLNANRFFILIGYTER
ncbi:MAG: hypothetical protein ACYS0G_10670 [Planctomycetota bacterium]|jgi:hypothetical protein